MTTYYTKPNYVSKTLVKEIYKHKLDKSIRALRYAIKEMETVEYFTIGRKYSLESNNRDLAIMLFAN